MSVSVGLNSRSRRIAASAIHRVDTIDVAGPKGPIAAIVSVIRGNAPATAAELAQLITSNKAQQAPIILSHDPHASELNAVAPGNYAACAQPLPADLAAITSGKLDLATLPFACTPIAVASQPERQRFTIAAP